jgi:hypothetical protein
MILSHEPGVDSDDNKKEHGMIVGNMYVGPLFQRFCNRYQSKGLPGHSRVHPWLV